ncbi:MAG TPA: hypothetical protein GX497_11800 [Bacillus bacterium]|nr:hypothetical protein [Bacillus sp. (in: firmicutes)]
MPSGIHQVEVGLPINQVWDFVKGLNEELSGGGYFLAEAMDKNKTRMTGFLEITAGGAMGPLVNVVLKSNLPKVTEEMTIAISTKLEELYRI